MSDGPSLHREALVWDNHACMPIRPDTAFLPELERYRASGVDVVSLNVVYDHHPWETAVKVLAVFREWLGRHADRFALVDGVESIDEARRSGRLAVTFDIEGMAALGGSVEMVGLYRDLGVRWILVAYNHANAAGGGCLDAEDPGLSAFGREVLGAMKRHGVVACCTHTGERTTMDVFEHAGGPVILSHSNPRTLCDHPRNVSDAVIDGCARTDGVIGIVGYGLFLAGGDVSPANVARHVDYVVQRVGPRHAGLSTDYVFDPAELAEVIAFIRQRSPEMFPEGDESIEMMPPESFPRVTDELLGLGYADDDVRAVLGGNWLRVAGAVWK